MPSIAKKAFPLDDVAPTGVRGYSFCGGGEGITGRERLGLQPCPTSDSRLWLPYRIARHAVQPDPAAALAVTLALALKAALTLADAVTAAERLVATSAATELQAAPAPES
jgi:hypothetical protein